MKDDDYILYVYKTTNTINNKIYIGQHIHKKHKNDTYLGSGEKLKEEMVIYGRKNFQKEILEYCTDYSQLNEKEIFWIKQFNSTNPDIGYNITAGGNQCKPTEEFIKRCKEARNNASDETKKEWYAKISKSMKERGTSKGKNNPMFGVEYTKERQEKCAKSKKENRHKHLYYTEEYRNNMAIRNTGEKNPNYDNKWSEEQKEKLSNYLIENSIHKGENNPNYGKFGKESSGYKEIPEEIKNNILYEYLNNFICIRKLSKKYNITERKVREIIIENNLEIKILYISKENEEKIIDMFLNQNISITKIAKNIGVEYRNIKKILVNNDIPTSKSHK